MKVKSDINKKGYNILLNDIISILEKAKYHTYKAVDNLRVQTYWQVGERITRDELQYKYRADYGEKIIENLANDIGITRQTLTRAVKFYRVYPIVTALRLQLSWTHYEVLLSLPSKQREFYELQTIQNTWSSRELENQIKSHLYERIYKEGKMVVSKPLVPALPEKLFKDTYNFDFIKFNEDYSEKAIEDGLIKNVEALLLEFGQDFSLSGRQRKIIIDNQIHTVDIEFFHRGIPCIVLVDIKVGKFRSEYVGQMNKYLNYYKEKRKHDWEKNPVGLIVCEYKGEEEVRFALGGLENKIFVAEYRKKLPTERDIRKKLKEIRKSN
ncbi:MAG: PDDEXK nuclease domain-containing protein [Elusimicrobiota bacterium]